MIKYVGILMCAALLCITGCGKSNIEESEMETMTQEVMETEMTTEMTTEAPRPEPSFAAQLKAAEDLEQLIIVEAHSREGIEATVTMHEKQDGIVHAFASGK